MSSAPSKPSEPLWAAYAASRSIANRNALVEHYLPLVNSAANALSSRLPAEVQRGDLIQWGSIGLIMAVERFDQNSRHKFASFVSKHIRGKMIDGLRNTAVRRRKVREWIKRLETVEADIRQDAGREPTPEEGAERLGMSPEKYMKVFRHRKISNDSLHMPIRTDRSRTYVLGDTIQYDAKPDDSGDVHIDAMEIINYVLKHHMLTDAIILRLYYLESMSMQEVGTVFGVSESLISFKIKRIREIVRRQFADAA